MAKSGRQNSRNKRDKKRLQKKASSAQWESLDVSGWFDTSVCFEQNDLDVFYPDDKKLPSPVYKDTLPGEQYFSWYAHEHPDKEDETAAVGLIKNWCATDRLRKTEENAPDLWKPLLNDLRALAKKGSVTANSFLGHVYANAIHVRKNSVKAQEYFQFAADNGDPLAMFQLWKLLPAGDGEALVTESVRLGNPQAVHCLIYWLYGEGYELTRSELDDVTSRLAALASNGCLESLRQMLEFLSSEYAEEKRSEYEPAMLRLLRRLADAGCPEAVEYQGRIFLRGVLRPKNLGEAARLLKRACELGAGHAPGVYAQSLLEQITETENTPEARAALLQEAREVLEKQCLSMPEDYFSKGVLGLILISSENDEDFAKGMELLNEIVPHGLVIIPLKGARFIIDWESRTERINAAFKLLNCIVSRKDRDGLYWLGRYCLLGDGLKQNRNKGLKLLRQAADLGCGEACLLLCETYLHGLCKTAEDWDEALDMLRDGIKMGSSRCFILYALALLGEISFFGNPPESETIDVVRHLLQEHTSSNDEYLLIAYSLIRTGADSAFKRYGLDSELQMVTYLSDEELATELARHCSLCLMAGSPGPLLYMADALKRIAKTKYAELYAATFAKEIPFMQGCSMEKICERLVFFVLTLPDSYEQFRLAYGEEYREKFQPVVY